MKRIVHLVMIVTVSLSCGGGIAGFFALAICILGSALSGPLHYASAIATAFEQQLIISTIAMFGSFVIMVFAVVIASLTDTPENIFHRHMTIAQAR